MGAQRTGLLQNDTVQTEILERFRSYDHFNELLENAEKSIQNQEENAFVLAQKIVNEIFQNYVK